MANYVGIDFGSLGLRTTYLNGERVLLLPPETQNNLRKGWLLCEPSPSNGLGITFPGLKSKLDQDSVVDLDGLIGTPSQLATDFFRRARTAVETAGVGPAHKLVVVIPARYTASRRAALRDAALRAGFAEVHLLNDSMAAVVSRAHPKDFTATVLVYSMGYAGFEIGLIRVARGHYRALGYEGGDCPAGGTIDELILQTWLATLAERNLRLDTHGWDRAQWLRLQEAASRVKESLSARGEAFFPIAVRPAVNGPPVRVQLRGKLDEVVAPWMKGTMDLGEKLLEESSVTREDLTEVLLVGGTTQISCISRVIEERLGHKPLVIHADALASGAALYGMRLGVGQTSAVLGSDKAESETAAVDIPASNAPIRAVLVSSAPDNSPDASIRPEGPSLPEHEFISATPATDRAAAHPAVLLGPARMMIDEGQTVRAREFLEAIVKEAQRLLAGMPSTAEAPVIRRVAARTLAQARRLLAEGKLEEAVRQTHLAWQQDPDSPEVFDQMIDVHVQAAVLANDIEGYSDAQRWLTCAYQHDQSNAKVHLALAARHFLQAKQLADGRRLAEAKAALKQCLYWSPDHEGARKLQQALARR
jgi:hypothetical protein